MIRTRRFILELGFKRNNPTIPVPSIPMIAKIITNLTGISKERLISEDKHEVVMFPKHIWRNVAFIYGYSFEQIATGTYCHRTTVYNSVKNHDNLMLVPSYRELYSAVINELNHFKKQANENDRRKFGKQVQKNLAGIQNGKNLDHSGYFL